MVTSQIRYWQYGSALHYFVIFAYLVVSVVSLRHYFIWDATSICGLLLLPLIFRVSPGRLSLRFLPLALLSAGLVLYLPVKTCLFLAALFALLLFLESSAGKINPATILTLLTISPIFKIVSNTFGFPLRLWLSNLAAEILSFSGIQVQAEGNIIILNGDIFSVDQACAGLSMLSLSFIICFFLISHFENRGNRRLTTYQIFGLLVLCFMLNLFGNLVRILMLVLFKIKPQSIYHDLVGVICLLAYCIIPLMFLARWLVLRRGSVFQAGKTEGFTPDHRFHLIHFSLFLVILYVSMNLSSMDSLKKISSAVRVEGFSRKVMENNILKFENKKGLIYFKPSTFYAPDHDPRICWQGSGYEFQSIKKSKILGCQVYTGVLLKGKDKIYSAWWFDSGKTKTISQFEWRWKALQSKEEFFLVNVNAETEKGLKKLVEQLFVKN